jgi:hypothetical protein
MGVTQASRRFALITTSSGATSPFSWRRDALRRLGRLGWRRPAARGRVLSRQTRPASQFGSASLSGPPPSPPRNGISCPPTFPNSTTITSTARRSEPPHERVFVDTVYWVAITNPKDQWHHAALQASRRLAGCHLVATDEVLTEVLAAFCEAGPVLRQNAALVRDLLADPMVRLNRNPAKLSFLARPLRSPPRQGIQPDRLHFDGERCVRRASPKS